MTVRRIRPGVARGSVRAPPSKSYTHRALVAAHLAHRPYRIVRPLAADDTDATRRGLDALGSRTIIGPQTWTVRPRVVLRRRRARIDCGESGTTLRFLVALAARQPDPIRFGGRGRLGRRPLSELLGALTTLGARVEGGARSGAFPLTIQGPIRGGRVRLDASRSSQFASALLLVLPTLSESSTLELTGAIVSEPYIDATLEVLRRHRIRWFRRGRRFEIPGGQSFAGDRTEVPGDASSAAYLWTAAAITGGSVEVRGVPAAWPQADRAILGILEAAGASVRVRGDRTSVEGLATDGFSVDLTAAPDLYPLAAVVAATVPRESRLAGAEHVAFKESDRRAGAIRLARALGAEVRPHDGALTIRGRTRPRGFRLATLNDHRTVMSAAVAALAGDRPSVVGDARAVRKSFPDFWDALSSLRSEEGP